jgi:hypothetical protein
MSNHPAALVRPDRMHRDRQPGGVAARDDAAQRIGKSRIVAIQAEA